MKTVKVIPIHKEGSTAVVDNYRPMSLLTSFYKIYGKLMHCRILKFLGTNDSLSELQYGFWVCCEHALLNAQISI